MSDKLPIECRQGWHKIIKECHQELLQIDPNYKPIQIKEKFGTLRYYFDASIKDLDIVHQMYEIVLSYEEASAVTCEECGNYGTLTKFHGWYKTLCIDHQGTYND